MVNPVQDRVAIVTGGTQGIGQAITKSLLQEDLKVVICSRNEEKITSCLKELRVLWGDAIKGFKCDVRSYSQVINLIDFTVKEYGRLDLLVNNAAVGIFNSVMQITPEQFKEVIETNLVGVFHCCHAAIPALKRSGNGYIINISSLAGKQAFSGGSAYNASKFGLNGFSEAIMQDLRYENIRVSYILPGSVDTNFRGSQTRNNSSWKLSPDDVARIVVELINHNPSSLPSRVEIRPSKPLKK